jgi:hypothetical protein
MMQEGLGLSLRLCLNSCKKSSVMQNFNGVTIHPIGKVNVQVNVPTSIKVPTDKYFTIEGLELSCKNQKLFLTYNINQSSLIADENLDGFVLDLDQ